MKVSTNELNQQVSRARSRGWTGVIAKAEKQHELPQGLLLALASRETNMEDIVGDGGHGRGLFQIDDRFWGDWLAKNGAPRPGTTPRLNAAADFAANMLASNIAFARKNGVGANDVLKFACSAYNAGQGGALSGFRKGDSDLNTANNDYGGDVLERLAAISGNGGRALAGVMPVEVAILKQGARGPKVTQLKLDLEKWFEGKEPGFYATFGVKAGPFFGKQLTACVREFQTRNKLVVDGECGAATLKALSAAAAKPAKRKSKGKAQPQPVRPDDGVLAQGDVGPGVSKLKKSLAAWFERADPGSWETFGVAAGPRFGPALGRAVREFQKRNGLLIDGEVGGETLDALRGVADSKKASATPKLRASFPDLKLDSPKKRGSTGDKVRLIQGWLCLHGHNVVPDGTYGKATARQVAAFQKVKGLPPTGVVDAATYAKLVHPMVVALTPISGKKSLGELIVQYARQHLAQNPHEVGGENRGPWVRLYTQGREGPDVPWCAGFATFILEQACNTLKQQMPFAKTLACDAMQGGAGASFLPKPTPSQRSRITPGSFFLRPATSGKLKYGHTGIVVSADADGFHTIEGNTNDQNSNEGFEVCARDHGYESYDFIVM
jgi:peptidoglycan hydrolase-like protein with peptidoglycan-binding domain